MLTKPISQSGCEVQGTAGAAGQGSSTVAMYHHCCSKLAAGAALLPLLPALQPGSQLSSQGNCRATSCASASNGLPKNARSPFPADGHAQVTGWVGQPDMRALLRSSHRGGPAPAPTAVRRASLQRPPLPHQSPLTCVAYGLLHWPWLEPLQRRVLYEHVPQVQPHVLHAQVVVQELHSVAACRHASGQRQVHTVCGRGHLWTTSGGAVTVAGAQDWLDVESARSPGGQRRACGDRGGQQCRLRPHTCRMKTSPCPCPHTCVASSAICCGVRWEPQA